MRRLYVGQFLNALGNGLTLALLVVYLVDVRGIAVPVATSLLAWQAVLTLLFSPVCGTLVDRFGPRPVLLGAVLVQAAGVLSLGHVTTAVQALGAMTVVAIGSSGVWGPAQALTARLVPSADRATAFGFWFMLLNLGLGMGGLIAATIVDLDDPSTFTLLYTLTATAYLALFVAVLSMGDVGGLPAAELATQPPPADPPPERTATSTPDPAPARAHGGGWREVLADRTLLRFAVTALIMLTFGYGSMDAGMALYITSSVHLPEQVIGVVFAANTAVIVVAQLVVLGLIRGRSRARTLAGVGLLWSAAWLLFASALGMPGQVAQVAALIAAMAVFAVGETLWSPTAPALLNDLAPEYLRGRYNAFQSILWGVSGALGPIITGVFLSDAGRGLQWTGSLAVGCALAAVLALRLRRHLTPDQDGRAAGPVVAP